MLITSVCRVAAKVSEDGRGPQSKAKRAHPPSAFVLEVPDGTGFLRRTIRDFKIWDRQVSLCLPACMYVSMYACTMLQLYMEGVAVGLKLQGEYRVWGSSCFSM